MSGRLVDIGGTRLYAEERGPSDALPVLCLQGGPGDEGVGFAGRLDPLAGRYRLVLVDQRGQGRSDPDTRPVTWTLEQLADDVSRLAVSLGLVHYAVLGHRVGAFVALRHACDAPGAAVVTIVSGGAASTRWFDAAEVLGHLSAAGCAGINVIDRLHAVTQPVLAISGRDDPTLPAEAAQEIAATVPHGECVLLEHAGREPFVEEPEGYVAAIGGFLDRHAGRALG